MRYRILSLIAAVCAGCGESPEPPEINESIQSCIRMDPSMKVLERSNGYARIGNGTSEISYFPDGFEYSFSTKNEPEIPEKYRAFIAYPPITHSTEIGTYFERTIKDGESKAKQFSCTSTSSDGRRTVRLTMHQGD